MNKLLISLCIALVYCCANTDGSCENLSFYRGTDWYAATLRAQYYIQESCSKYIIKNILYPCTPIEPRVECQTDADCNGTSVCAQGGFPTLCSTCSSTPQNTYYENFTVIVNETEKMLTGNPWITDSFYNHTGVDLINTYESWSWNVKGTALRHTISTITRSTWGDAYDGTFYVASTSIYSSINDTHIQLQSVYIDTTTFDNGKIDVTSSPGPVVTYHKKM